MKSMSAELKSLLDRPRTGPMKPRNRFDETGRSVLELDTQLQVKLWRAANRLLAKDGFFAPKEQAEPVVLPAEACGSHGLRPTWHGRP